MNEPTNEPMGLTVTMLVYDYTCPNCGKHSLFSESPGLMSPESDKPDELTCEHCRFDLKATTKEM